MSETPAAPTTPPAEPQTPTEPAPAKPGETPAPNNQPEGTDGTPANTDGIVTPPKDANAQPPAPDEGSSVSEPSFFDKLLGKKKPEDKSFMQEFETKLAEDRKVADNKIKQLEHLQNGMLPKDLAEEVFKTLADENSVLKQEISTLKTSFDTFKEELSRGKGFPSGQNPFMQQKQEPTDYAALQAKHKKNHL